MRKLILAGFAAMAMLGMAVTGAYADNDDDDDRHKRKSSKGAIVSKAIGTYGPSNAPQSLEGTCPETGCEGSLIVCAPDEGLSPISQTFYYLRGICDNREANGLPPCAGRYVGYGEECSRGVDGHESADTNVISRVTDGKFRICFSDPALIDAEADCALAEPTAKVIAEGTTQSHTNHVRGTEILLGVGETILEDDHKWRADGERHDWSKNIGKITVVHSQAQINGGRCAVTDPCGVSSTGVDAGRKD